MAYPQIRFISLKDKCGIEECRFSYRIHAHCTVRGCHFCSDDELIISNHVVIFHADLPFPKHVEFFHIDFKCSKKIKSLESSIAVECPYNGKKSHYHCLNCRKHFVHLSEHPSRNCKSLTRREFIKEVCSRPFCKLKKRRFHFHCAVCDQGFSDGGKLYLHAVKHKSSLVKSAAASTDGLPHKLNLWTSGRHLRSRATSMKDGLIVNGSSNQISPNNFDSTELAEQDWLPLDLSMNKPAENCAPLVAVSSEISCVNEELPFTVRRVTFSF